MNYEEVLHIHDELIRRFGGSFGLRSESSLRAAVDQPYLSFEGKDLYPSIIDKAACLGFGIIQSHAFVDGNKRTGGMCAMMLLSINGISFSPDDQEWRDVLLLVASNKMNRDEFNKWLHAAVE
ncbi:type II toxin-antitoxin system death-on-curing family toxin [Bifidobacterium dolichotidis]|uniref:type II toxin-antitoxin system death-on-curing family toxin n=1 Tax=Bifidobacterium dolichotidis TaxID=2306976 RepID=UPI0013DE067C|nr:type II toxin-antitoxin system death-on-curing family toxin [Bifidobacterium dolichotidis]